MTIYTGFALICVVVLGAYLDMPLVSLAGLIGVVVLGGLSNLKQKGRSIPAEQPVSKVPTMRRK